MGEKRDYLSQDGVESWIEDRGEAIAVAQTTDRRIRMAFSVASLRSNRLPEETPELCATRIARGAILRKLERD